MSVSLKIKIFESSGTRLVQISKSTLTIGSASHCDIVLEHESIVGEHVRAWLEGGRIWVQDLGSPAGTALNDIRLPALKPMLVRDLDVLRLGEGPSTIGLEAIHVRAPVVKPKAPEPVSPSAVTTDAAKGLSNAELQKRRDEAEELARQVAEMKLQLQMNHLEKDSADEAGQQAAELHAEVERVREQKAKWDETLRQMEKEKQTMRESIDKELAEFKAKALKDLRKVAGREADVQVQTLQREIESLREKQEALRAELERAEGGRSALEAELQKAAQAEKNLSDDTQRITLHANTEITKLSEDGRRLQDEIKKLNAQKAKLAESLRAAEDEREALRGDLKRAMANEKLQNANTERHIQSVNAEIKKLSDDARRFVEEIEKLNVQKNKLDESLRASEREKENLRAELKRLAEAERELSQGAQRHTQAVDAEMRKLADDTRRLSDEIRKLNDQKTKLTDALQDSEREKESLRAELREAEDANRSALDDTQRLNMRAGEELKELEDEGRRLRDEVRRLNEQKAKLMENLKDAEGEREAYRAELKKALSQSKAGGADTERQIANLTGEIKKLNEQKSKLTESLRQVEVRAGQEVSEALLNEAQKFDEWKDQALKQMGKVMQKLSAQKTRLWASRQVNPNMMQEFEADVTESLRRVFNNESEISFPPPSGKESRRAADEMVSARHERRRLRRERERSSQAWRSVSLMSFVVALVLAGVWFATSYFRGRPGARSLSSNAVEAPPPARKPEKPHRVIPKTDKKYHGSYTDNVLYLEHYVAAEGNMDFRKKWVIELNRVAAKDWKMDTWTVSPIGVLEQTLIQDLDRMKNSLMSDKEAEGIAKMRERENKFLRDLESVFKTRANVERFLKFKRAFYLKNQAYLSASS